MVGLEESVWQRLTSSNLLDVLAKYASIKRCHLRTKRLKPWFLAVL